MSYAKRLELIALPSIPLILKGDDLVGIFIQSLQESGVELVKGDVLVIAQKIVSKSEGRLFKLSDVVVSEKALQVAQVVGKDPRLVELVLHESTEIVAMRQDVLVVEHKLGFVMANAGIDQSNVLQSTEDDMVLLLPENPDGFCSQFRDSVQSRCGCDIGVVINDSHGRAWRNGAVGVAIGSAGFPALLDMRGTKDLFERSLKVTQVGCADEMASAASLLMGQANEGVPMVLIRGLHFHSDQGQSKDLIRPKSIDLFR